MSDEKVAQLNNAIQIAKINLDAARQKQSDTKDKIMSDIDGTVAALSAIEGSTSSNMQPAITVQDTENLKVTASIGSYDADKVQIGQGANIKSGGKQYKGKVSFIDPAAKKAVTQTGGETTLGLDIDILDKAPDLKIDFDTDVDIL